MRPPVPRMGQDERRHAQRERQAMSVTSLAPPAGAAIGPLEQRYRQHANFRAASDQTRVTPTHWHIAVANGLGWGFDGMDGVIFALASPLIIRDYAVTIPQYRSGLQIALLIGIVGMYAWPWLADRYGRRTLLALNIALFSLMMPVVAICPTFGTFVAARCVVNFALNGEWALGSMLVAETWPARLRGRVIGINRGTWCFGAAAAGAIATCIIADYGWRVAFAVPAVVALIAVYVRAKCPESPYWVRMQDRKRRIAELRAAGQTLSATDQEWLDKANKIPLRQLFLPDMWRNTAVATFVACCCTTIYGTVGGWMPLYLAQERALVHRHLWHVLYLVGPGRLPRACWPPAGSPIVSAAGRRSMSCWPRARSSSRCGSTPRPIPSCGSTACCGASASSASGHRA